VSKKNNSDAESYLLSGYVELAANDLCHLESAFRFGEHGSEAVQSLNKK